jgi:hypothetical protein
LIDAALEPLRRWRFLALTLLLCVWMLSAPHVGERWLGHLLMQLFLMQFVVVTLWANPRWGTMGRVLISCWLLSVAGNVATLLPLGAELERLARGADNVAAVPLLVLLAVGILRYVFTRRQLDTDGVFATVAAYLLLAFAFAQVYVALQTWSPESFHLPVEASLRTPPQLQSDFIYYSLVTLATVGYGDILPVSEAARTLAVIEATVGQFYVAVVVAVFVGMYASHHRSGN